MLSARRPSTRPAGAHVRLTIYDNRFLFTGREYAATYRSIYNTPAFNFYEYRARAYNPTLGRFMSEDPKLFDAGDYNLFRYCHNDPIDFTDPMGTLEQYHATLAHSVDRLWEMTKWFDRSNILQGNFPGFGALSGQSDRDAKGAAVAGQGIPPRGTQDRRSSSRGEPTSFRILEGQTVNHGTWNSYEYQAYANGKPVFHGGYEVKEEFKEIYSKNVDFHQTNGWTPLDRRGRWGDDVGFHSRLPKMALDIREQRFYVRPIGDHVDGTLMQSHFLHMSNVSQGKVDNVVVDMGPHGYFDEH